MANSGYDNNGNEMNNTSVDLIVDDPANKPMKRRKKKDCKYCRNKELENARKHLAIISIPIDDGLSEESTNNIINIQHNICSDDHHNQQMLPVLNGILCDNKIIFTPAEKYWPRVMKTNSIYSEDHNQRKIKNTDSSGNSPIKVEEKNPHWTQTVVYQLNVMRGCNATKFIFTVAILSLLAIGAIALYIVFEPEKVQIIKQYLHLSQGINNSFVNHTYKPQRLIANVSRLENLTVLVSNRDFGILSTQTMNNESPLKPTTSFHKPEEIVTILHSINTRYCNNCYEGEVCISLANENVATCKMAIDINDTTGCAGLCSIEEKCHQLDPGIFRCVKMEHQCLEDEWACSNALCIPLVKLCDGHMNCYDHSDEYNCDCNLRTHFQCGKNTSCLPLDQRCDGKIDCWDATDEMNCTLSCLSTSEFTCSNGECVSETRFCDGFKDCSDGSDEPHGCHGRCNKHEYTCGNKRCVVRNFKCNGVDDCGDGSDELYCRS